MNYFLKIEFLKKFKLMKFARLFLVEIRRMSSFRNRPFIVICGCTGTGKTKLSIQLAKWLIQSGKTAEVINADAMQLYKNLDIITNKASVEEMQGVRHHLLGYLDSTCISNNVIDYKNLAVNLIDSLLEQDKIPILVGGTHYYIQSVIWDILLDNKRKELNKRENSILSAESNSEIVKLITESPEEDLNVKLHDSSISTEEIYKQLEQVDLQSAQKIHPNDRRKLCRALQIYYTYGMSKTDLLDLKNKQEGTNYPLRYKNICMFVMNCDSEILNKRLDDRVDQMISNGLLEEIEIFKQEFETKFKDQTFKDYSRDFEFGIFQSIGFKEFDDYLKHVQYENKSDSNYEKIKNELFNKAILDMKLSTRRYAKTQIRWVRNRFIKRAEKCSPIVYELDTSDLDKWDENIYSKAMNTFSDYLSKYEENNQVELNYTEKPEENSKIFEYNKCEICNRIFVNKFQWECHLKSSGHKKKKESLRRKELQKTMKIVQEIKDNYDNISNK